ncbi:MAG: hypothetical protein J6L83_08380 [Clostridia bacterium]|nr:hypothetical protein [Clostridia bacterium]
MSNTEKGILIFNEWFDAISDLKGTDFKALILAMYRFQTFGEEPPEFKGKARGYAAIIFPQLRRRMELIKAGAEGAKKRLSATGEASSGASGEASSPLDAIEKKIKEEKRKEYLSSRAREMEEKRKWNEFFDAAVARSLNIAAPTDEPSVPSDN